MIDVVCRTNLDLASERWPDQLPAVPRVGDHVASGTVHRAMAGEAGFQLELAVVSVTWRPIYEPRSQKARWMPYIELHMTKFHHQLISISGGGSIGSIRAFYEWYAPLVGRSVGSFI